MKAFTILLQSGVRPNQDGNFAVQMVAMETGHVSVKLEVTALPGRSQILGDLTLRDELQIQVRMHKSDDKKAYFTYCRIGDITKGMSVTWPRGYETFFTLNSTEHETDHANKC